MDSTNATPKNRKKVIFITLAVILAVLFILPIATRKNVSRDGVYTDKEYVALYLKKYHELPCNFITKDGYTYYKNHSISADGKTIGGDTHVNTSELTSFGVKSNVSLKECDIRGETYALNNRGTLRLVYTCNRSNVRVFYTNNHYVSYTELTSFALNAVSNVFWIVFALYAASLVAICVVRSVKNKPALVEAKNDVQEADAIEAVDAQLLEGESENQENGPEN